MKRTMINNDNKMITKINMIKHDNENAKKK